MRSGQAYTKIIPFDAGLPDGVVSYTLSENGTTLSTGTVTPAAGAVSVILPISGALNTLTSGQVLGHRDLVWSYLSSSIAVNGNERYSLEAALPFGVSPAGVRQKLGVDEAADLPDEQIPLIRAYLQFQAQATAASVTLSTFQTADSYSQLLIADAIEAMAALELIPTLQVRLAQRETSGTNAYERQKIDWTTLRAQLGIFVSQGLAIALPTTLVVGGELFLLSTPSVALFPQ